MISENQIEYPTQPMFAAIKVGTIIKATGLIWRRDRQFTLRVGETAKVVSVFKCEDGTPIIDIYAPEREGRIGDIVCTGNCPIEIINL